MLRARALLIVVGLLAAPLTGCLGDLDPEPPLTAVEAGEPRVVVAVIDTGINLFHAEYRRDGGTAPPYLPEGAEPVTLDFAHDDWDEAVDANRDALMGLELRQLYTFPGTKVVGAISFGQASDDWPLLLDRPGYYTHGTMTTSRAAGNSIAIGGAEPEVDLVLVQGFTVEAVEWAAAQPWIDVISISAGLSPFTITPVVPNLLDDGAIPAYHAASHAKPFFASSGNGVLNAGLVGYPSWTRGSSGVPDAISVGANDNDRMSQWHNQDPYVSADGCANPSANPGSMDEVWDRGGGTSSATPFSAGGGARLLLEARRVLADTHVGPRVDDALDANPDGWDSLAPSDNLLVLARAGSNATLPAKGPLADGVFTLREFKDVLYHTALVTPTDDESDGAACDNAPAPGDGMPEDRRFPIQGYGELNHASIDHAMRVLHGEADPLDRPDADAEYARAHAVKTRVVTGGDP